MKLQELINYALLDEMIALGFIREVKHPSLPLRLLNYTEKAQFAREWNDATLACRGLIYDARNFDIVARPFPKFFNHGEPGAADIGFDELVQVTDKIDGSLGVLYPTGVWSPRKSTHMIATRGSFSSNQALHASNVWIDRYAEDMADRLSPTLTYLFEIVYPENRIVVDYRGLDDLVLIGAVDIGTGFTWGPEILPAWPGPRTRTFPYQTLREAVHSRPRPGKEGFVVRALDQTRMVKVKYDEYVSLHRVVTGLNEKEIWRRCMKADLELPPEVERWGDVIKDIPDELHEWISEVVSKLIDEFQKRRATVGKVWYHRPNGPEWGESERDYRARCALYFKGTDQKWLQKALWIMYDGNDPREFLWKTIEPKGDTKK